MYYQPELDLTPEEILEYLRKSRTDDPTLDVTEILAKHETIHSAFFDLGIIYILSIITHSYLKDNSSKTRNRVFQKNFSPDNVLLC